MKKDLIPLFKVYMSKKASKEASKIINSGFIGQGPIVEQFEEDLRHKIYSEFVVTTKMYPTPLNKLMYGAIGDRMTAETVKTFKIVKDFNQIETLPL